MTPVCSCNDLHGCGLKLELQSELCKLIVEYGYAADSRNCNQLSSVDDVVSILDSMKSELLS